MIGNPVAVGFIAIVRGLYWKTRMRVRQWGRLPLRRGPTVLVANHQHEDESEIVCERTFLAGPWRQAVLTASSRRMYEPGFFATRMPALRFARRWNASAMLMALGMLPLEHELSSRPLASLAFDVQRVHGDIPLATIARDEALRTVPGAERCSDLLRREHFDAAQRHVKLALLNEPYRSEALARLRTVIDEDIARIRAIVRSGATFYVTPEGRYSTDGAMRPLRGIVTHLAPLAEMWLCAIAFDPFRGRRLSMLYRIVRPRDSADLATSLAAARPVTTSALLATRLAELDESTFARDDLVAAVTVLRDALPPGAFADPELRDPADCVDDALHTLAQRGTLVRDNGRYRLSATRTDSRFPLVADIIAYQRRFHAETVAALRRLAGAGSGS